MLTQEEIIKKLYEQPNKFYKEFFQKHYGAASLTAFAARIVANFVELDEEKMIELFGTRQADKPIEGLIKEDDAIMADWKTVLLHRTLQEQTYEEKREREEAWRKSNLKK